MSDEPVKIRVGDPDQEAPPSVKVVDRRWWVRGDQEATGDTPSIKPSYVEELEGRIAEKDKLLQATIEKYREAGAEFEAARARLRREVMKDAERGRRAVLAEFLEVADNLDRALEAARTTGNIETLIQGVHMVRAQFLTTLDGFGVKPIEALGQPFDPAMHDAVATVPTAEPTEDGRVTGIIKRGYLIGEEVLRPATVAVAKLGDRGAGE